MRFHTSKFVQAALVAALVLSIGASAAPAATSHSHAGTASKEVVLKQAMRKLWEDHVTWTRLVIVSTAASLPDLEVTTQRLLQNQTDIGNAVKPFYGEEAGSKLTELLKSHIIGAADLMAAVKANDSAKIDAAKKSWYANGDEISAFLSGANPKQWPLADMQSMMRQHLDLTATEAVDQLQGRYAESVAGYDKVHDEILTMADMLSDGIIKQFPKKF